MVAGGILGMVGRRVGLLDDKELQAIRAARLSWLRAGSSSFHVPRPTCAGEADQ